MSYHPARKHNLPGNHFRPLPPPEHGSMKIQATPSIPNSHISPASQPKYRRIANDLLRQIRETMPVGSMLPPETELATRFGVHVLTVSKALRTLQEWGVIERRRAVGTRVVNPQGGNWVCILCEMNVFSPCSRSLFQRGVIYHLRHFLAEAGLPTRVSIGESEPGAESGIFTSMDFVADLEAGRLAGVIGLSTNAEDWWLQKLLRQGIPAIGSNATFPHHILFDPWEDLNRAFRCLLDLGRSHIAYIGWDQRARQVIDELSRCYPLVIRKQWIKDDIHPVRPGAGWEEFREIWSASEEKPDAIILNDEHLLPDIENAILEIGIRVPEDLVILSHRTRGSERTLPFPVIFQEADPKLYAHRMAEHFLRLYRGEAVASHAVIVPRMFLKYTPPIGQMVEVEKDI